MADDYVLDHDGLIWRVVRDGGMATRAEERMSRLGARLGDWNDRHSRHDRHADAPLRWRVIDAIAGWLYVTPDRRKP